MINAGSQETRKDAGREPRLLGSWLPAFQTFFVNMLGIARNGGLSSISSFLCAFASPREAPIHHPIPAFLLFSCIP